MNLPNFKKVLRGLDPEEVNDFWVDMYKQLTELSAVNKELGLQNAGLEAQNQGLVEKLEVYKNLEIELREAIMTGRTMATRLEQDASKKAESMLADAEAEVKSLFDQSATIIEEAQQKADAMLLDAQTESDNMLAKINKVITTRLSEADTKLADAQNQVLDLNSKILELETTYAGLKEKREKLDTQIDTATEYLRVIKQDVFGDIS